MAIGVISWHALLAVMEVWKARTMLHIHKVSFCRFSNFTGVKANGRIKTCTKRTWFNSVGFSILFMNPGEVWFFLRTLRTNQDLSFKCLYEAPTWWESTFHVQTMSHSILCNRTGEKKINKLTIAPMHLHMWLDGRNRHQPSVEITKRRQPMLGCFCSIDQSGKLFPLIFRIRLLLRSMNSKFLLWIASSLGRSCCMPKCWLSQLLVEFHMTTRSTRFWFQSSWSVATAYVSASILYNSIYIPTRVLIGTLVLQEMDIGPWSNPSL